MKTIRRFDNPSKPIGAFYDAREAEQIGKELGWTMKEDSGRGWRHVVPSPRPRHICDISLVQALARRGSVVIAGGGGGIPVLRDSRGVRRGIQAVVDKDLTSAHMANVLGIEMLVILTAVPKVAINFGTADQQDLDRVTLGEMKALHAEGHFPPGSMGPKIDAAIHFLENGGTHVVIADINEVLPALTGESGTHITADA